MTIKEGKIIFEEDFSIFERGNRLKKNSYCDSQFKDTVHILLNFNQNDSLHHCSEFESNSNHTLDLLILHRRKGYQSNKQIFKPKKSEKKVDFCFKFFKSKKFFVFFQQNFSAFLSKNFLSKNSEVHKAPLNNERFT